MIYNLEISQIDVKPSGRFTITTTGGNSSIKKKPPLRSNYNTDRVNDFIESISRNGESFRTVVTNDSQIDVDNYIANVI